METKRLDETNLTSLKPKQIILVAKLEQVKEKALKIQAKRDKLNDQMENLMLKFNEIRNELNKSNITLGYDFIDTLA